MVTKDKIKIDKSKGIIKIIQIPRGKKEMPKLEQKDFFTDFTTLRWVKWTTRQPDWNGSVYVRWNGKYTSHGTVWDGYLTQFDGAVTNAKGKVLKSGKYKVTYNANQKKIMQDMYWLEEIHDHEGFRAYRDKLIEEFLNEKE